jgi:phosphoribosyl 1,2-cyclic phosphodiesterase
LRKNEYENLKISQPYLVDISQATGSGFVPKLFFHPFEESKKELMINEVKFDVLPVFHGESYMANGYKFGNVVYLSDVVKIPDEVREKINGCDILVIDCLTMKGNHKSHYSFEQTLAEIRLIKPKKSYLIGMSHSIEHETMNKYLKEFEKENIFIELAFDGMCLDINL